MAVSREHFKEWKDKGHNHLTEKGNKIRFKVMELDEEKFVPVKSEWISGEVEAVSEDGKVELRGVEQPGKPYRSKFELPEHNMDELQLHRTFATKEQL